MSTVLFNLVLENILRESNMRTHGMIYHGKHQCIAYADDIVLLTRSKEELQKIFTRLEQKAGEHGLHINREKTKYMEMGSKQNMPEGEIMLKGNENREYYFEIVNSFEYLGVTLTTKNNEKEEIDKRILKGNKSASGLSRIINSKSVSRNAKIRLYKTVIQPTVLYGSETWTMTQETENRIGVWERKMLRRIFGGKNEEGVWRRRTNNEVMELYGQPSIIKVAKMKRLRWLGHVIRMSNGRTTKQALEGGVGIRRRRGRPKTRWLEAAIKDLEQLGVQNWKQKAMDRRDWRKIVEAMGL